MPRVSCALARVSPGCGTAYATLASLEGFKDEPTAMCKTMRHSDDHLLIVDDDQEMRDLLRKVLEKEGYRVSRASDAEEAMGLLTRGDFDLVVTDMLMPHDGGLELLRAIRRILPALPVIIVTAFGDWHTYCRALELGAAAFISKPLRMSELVAAVHSALAKRGAAASP